MKKMVILLSILMAGQAAAGVVSPGLESVMANLNDQDLIKVLVVMQDQPDIISLDQDLRANKATMSVRHRVVVGTLQDAAKTSQRGLLQTLANKSSNDGIVGYVPHWIVNVVVVKGTVAAIRDLAARSDVKTIEPDLEVELIAPVMVKAAAPRTNKGAQGMVVPGVQVVGADRVWHELGITGAGSLVANMDSGVDGTHPALSGRWRGNFVAASAAWLDMGSAGSPSFPVDDFGHGTHVMGTITGATAFDTLGVAPGAQWIATNAINARSIEELDNNIIAGFEWLADPDGDPNTTDDVPDVCHNSWGVTTDAGFLDCDSSWWSVIDNCEAAGVVVTFSAGNEGPGAGTLRSPGNRASTPTNCFTVGSTSGLAPYVVSSFSSRGPSQCGGPYAIKPEIMAPGESIYSSIPGGAYGYMDGTSMAGPHVAGVVALMREAAPNLDVVTIKEVLMATAIDLGVPGEDNDYGHGMVDAYAAVTAVLGNVNTISGVVTAQDTGQPLAGVVVQDMRGQTRATTAGDGSYQFTVLAGQTTLRAFSFGYINEDFAIDLAGGGTTTQNMVMVPMPLEIASGIVSGPDGQAMAGATVRALGTPVDATVTDVTGYYVLSLPAGEDAAYEIMATAPNLAYEIRPLGLQGARTLDFDLPVLQSDGFESGGFATLPWGRSGSVLFSTSSDQAYEGALSARTGSITHGQSTELALDYYLSTTDEFSFWYKVDSEPAYDTLKLYIDGALRGTWSGATSWARYAEYLPAGLHAIRWVYSKDSSVSAGADGAWIDLVSMPGTGAQPLAAVTLSDATLTATVPAAGTGSVPLVLGNVGSFGLEYSVTPVQVAAETTPWISVSPAAGTIYPTSTQSLVVSFDPGYMSAGVHQANLVIASNDPAHPDTSVVVEVTVTAVSAVDVISPGHLTLGGAVPNPFNPATEIQFSLPAATHSSLRIYDVSGRLVRTLVDRELAAGAHSEHWDGRNNEGQGAASGVYFIRLVTDSEKSIKPMTLVR